MFIYAITNDVNQKVYIGLHSGRDLRTRWATHRAHAKRGSRALISLALRKHGEEKFHIVSVWSGHVSVTKLYALEKYFISSFGTRTPSGYNMTYGGDGTIGYRHTDAERQRRSEKMRMQIKTGNIPSLLGTRRDPKIGQKISITRTGKKNKKPFSDEVRRHISEGLKGNKYSLGHKWSSESIAKRTASRAGYHHSEETKKKMSETKKKRREVCRSSGPFPALEAAPF